MPFAGPPSPPVFLLPGWQDSDPAHWQSRWEAARGDAALLVAPPDLDRADVPPQLAGWRPPVRRALPFPSLAVLSRDDPFGGFAPTQALARDWGAAVIDAGARGHLNGDSGLGGWHEGRAWLTRLARPSAG